jgi:hypothetical protein
MKKTDNVDNDFSQETIYARNKELEIKLTNSLSEKISKKEHILHFLPECFNDFKNLGKIRYKDNNLKVDYLIDLMSTMILKYYSKKDNKFNMNAEVLKKRYGAKYNYYVDYLVSNGFIEMTVNYKKNKHSRIYKINSIALNGKMGRYKNYDKILLTKYKRRILGCDFITNTNNFNIDIIVAKKLINDLFCAYVDLESSAFFLDILADEKRDIYNRNMYSIHAINENHIFYHFDDYGRMHTNFTILKSTIRKNYLMMDGEYTVELDISNSQPLFLAKLIDQSNTKWVNREELELFKKLTIGGVFYQWLNDTFKLGGKKNVKKMIYQVFFGTNRDEVKYNAIFKSAFPTIYNFIKLYKKEHKNYKILSHTLQRMESDFLFNKVIKRIYKEGENVKIITIHDSIKFKKSDRELCERIFNEELEKEFKNFNNLC